MKHVVPYLKALTGALVAGLTALEAALDDDLLSRQEGVGVLIATLTGLVAVWAIPNLDPKGKHQEESVQPAGRDDHGHSDVIVAVVVVIAVLLVLALFGFLPR